MKFGASSWPFQWEPPYEDCIKRVAGCGFKAIELIGWNVEFLKDYYTPQKIRDLKACVDGEGLIVSRMY
jgi:sugar phosphate isomerase/epimerase